MRGIEDCGNDMNRLNLEWWRRQCGVVMQDGVIFSESIERNIAVSDGEIDRNRVEEAAMVANIKEYINSLPLKYDTKIVNRRSWAEPRTETKNPDRPRRL